jgi:hypothetical protein
MWNKVSWLEKATGLAPWWKEAALNGGVTSKPAPSKIVPMPNRSRYTCDQLATAGKCASLAVGTCDLSCARCCSDVAPGNAGGKSCDALAAEGRCASLPYYCFASCGKCKSRGSTTG